MALSAGQQQEVTFDKHEAQLLRNVYTTDPVCIAAYNAICARLVGGGLVFTSETHDAVASVAFQQHIDTYWLPFAANLLRELLILGYCAAPSLGQFPPSRGPPRWFRYDAYIYPEITG